MELLVYSIAFKDWLMIIYSDRNYSLLSYIYIYIYIRLTSKL